VTEKVYGIWLAKEQCWATNGMMADIVHSPHRGVVAAELQRRSWARLKQDPTIEIIGEDGRPEREDPESPSDNWIAVEDVIAIEGQVPSCDTPVRVRDRVGNIGVAHYDKIGVIWNSHTIDPDLRGDLPVYDIDVTHWKPIKEQKPPP